MRNANKSPKISYSAMVREVEVIPNLYPGSITIKSQSVLLTGRRNHNTKFQWNQLITFAVLLLTDGISDRSSALICTDNFHLGRDKNAKHTERI